jgi:DNA (cytosine-5)-methyltransferase 1
MLGNAVPSLVAEVIAREIRSQLLGKPFRTKNLRLLPPARNLPSHRERVAKVPAIYQSLIGHHAAHPGEGRGNRARARMAA